MKIATLLLSLDNQYNGHYQTVIKGLSVEQALEICKELEEYLNSIYFFCIELWSDGSFSVVQKDYWKPGEHPNGYTDRIICASGE